VAELGAEISADFVGKEILLIPILNGSFVFAADLARHITVACQVSFIKVASYHGTSSSGQPEELLGLAENIAGRHLVVVEDIVDTGITMHAILQQLQAQQPASLHVATFLAKPAAMVKPVPLHYAGFHIGPEFVVGYGMDYDGYGRELPGLWVAE
jgi:hypoxanthine phosphoribosyltransferase